MFALRSTSLVVTSLVLLVAMLAENGTFSFSAFSPTSWNRTDARKVSAAPALKAVGVHVARQDDPPPGVGKLSPPNGRSNGLEGRQDPPLGYGLVGAHVSTQDQ